MSQKFSCKFSHDELFDCFLCNKLCILLCRKSQFFLNLKLKQLAHEMCSYKSLLGKGNKIHMTSLRQQEASARCLLPMLLFNHSETHMFIHSQKRNRTENILKSLIWKPPTAYMYVPMTDNVLSIPL